MEARALGGLGDAEYARGRMASAHRHFSRCAELSRASGAGRIEVANLSMVAHTQVYLNDFSDALATSQTAVELAARVGHHRAEIIAHYAACNVFRTTGEFARVKMHAERALILARQLGAKRFEAVSLNDLAMVARAEASSAEAMDLLYRALAISRETGLSFVGPWILGHLAVTTEDPIERQAALTEGEEILRKGAVEPQSFVVLPVRDRCLAGLSGLGRRGALQRGARGLYAARAITLGQLLRPIWTRCWCTWSVPHRTGDDMQAWRPAGRGRAPWHRSGAWGPRVTATGPSPARNLM